MEKVLTTTDYALLLEKRDSDYPDTRYFMIVRHANLVSQSLELGMFVPCINGKPVEEPESWKSVVNDDPVPTRDIEVLKEYHKAKKQVLFEEWEYFENQETEGWCISNKKITITSNGLQWRQVAGEKLFQVIEDLARQVDLKPTESFSDRINPKTN